MCLKNNSPNICVLLNRFLQCFYASSLERCPNQLDELIAMFSTLSTSSDPPVTDSDLIHNQQSSSFKPPHSSLHKSGTLHPYQLNGVSWMYQLHQSHLCGILADEMGLGKGVQAISLIGLLKELQPTSSPHVIIAPLAGLSSWKREFSHWLPSAEVTVIRSLSESHLDDVISRSEVVVTTPDVISSDLALFKQIDWNLIVIDDVMPPFKRSLSSFLSMCTAQSRFLLTGSCLDSFESKWKVFRELCPNLFPLIDPSDDFYQSMDVDFREILETIASSLYLRRLKIKSLNF
ncbi:hypothetical protein GEMRC1_005259 [Eukaryota sp. GEM-RC1]